MCPATIGWRLGLRVGLSGLGLSSVTSSLTSLVVVWLWLSVQLETLVSEAEAECGIGDVEVEASEEEVELSEEVVWDVDEEAEEDDA